MAGSGENNGFREVEPDNIEAPPHYREGRSQNLTSDTGRSETKRHPRSRRPVGEHGGGGCLLVHRGCATFMVTGPQGPVTFFS
jgi:hypothetical protein